MARKPTDEENPVGASPEEDAFEVEGHEEIENIDDMIEQPGEKKPPANGQSEETVEELRAKLKETEARATREAEARQMAEKKNTPSVDAIIQEEERKAELKKKEITSRVSEAKTNLESIKQQLKQARAAGDSDAEVELSDKMTDARYKLNATEWELNNQERWEKQELETWKKNLKSQADKPKGSPYTAKEQEWINKNPAFNTNKRFARIAKNAAQEARDDGIKQDSKAYFNFIETALREYNLLDDEEDDTPAKPPKRETKSPNTTVSLAPNRNGDGTGTKTQPVSSKYPYLPRGYRIPAEWAQAAAEQGFEGKEGILEYANMRLEDEAKTGTRQ